MDLPPEVFDEQSFTDEGGIEEWKVIELFEQLGEDDDDLPDWEHWRTSPNHTCIEGGDWTVQIGRNDPVFSIDIVLSDRTVSAVTVLETPVALMEMAIATAKNPKKTLVELVELSDSDGVWVYECDEDDIPSMAGYAMRQAAWGDQVTQPDSKGDA